jgi:hypothetical protein
MASCGEILLFAEKSVCSPRHNVGGACRDRERASGAHIFFDSRGRALLLHVPVAVAAALGAPHASEDALDVERFGRGVTAARAA